MQYDFGKKRIFFVCYEFKVLKIYSTKTMYHRSFNSSVNKLNVAFVDKSCSHNFTVKFIFYNSFKIQK